MSDMINIDGVKIAERDMGSLWTNFENCLTSETAIIFNSAYNLIILSVDKESIALDFTHILIDETTSTVTKINFIREMLIRYIVDILGTMGVIIDREYVDLDTLPALVTLLNTFMVLDGLEDQLGILDILEDAESDNKYKLIKIIMILNMLDYEENFDVLISKVENQVIKAIRYGIVQLDDYEPTNPYIINRVRQNREFLKGTLAHEYISDGGTVGLSSDALFTLFEKKLAPILASSIMGYYKEVLSMLIVSSMSDIEISESYEVMVGDYSDDPVLLIKGTKLLEEVILSDEQG